MPRIIKQIAIYGLLALLASCSTQPTTPVPFPTPTPLPTNTAVRTLSPSSTPIPARPTSTETPISICSPLADIQTNELREILTNPLEIPASGSDAGHHGLDFAYYQRGDHGSIEGLPVYSMLTGKITAALSNTWPYGNVIIIETPLSELPTNWAAILSNIELAPRPTPDGRLFCPEEAFSTPTQGDNSLYILYAHLQQPPNYQISDPVPCGQQIGLVGNTGYSGNPHLHLEYRLGPSGAAFTEITHYINTATQQEMVNYCLWRISGAFQVIDPFLLMDSQP